MNTRKYPRTLAEAFPRTATYASAIERPPAKPGLGRWLAFSVFAVICLLLVARSAS